MLALQSLAKIELAPASCGMEGWGVQLPEKLDLAQSLRTSTLGHRKEGSTEEEGKTRKHALLPCPQ